MVRNKAAKKVAFWGIMTALTVTVSFLESLVDIPIAFPGAKLGLANIVVVSSAVISGAFGAIYITLIKSLFVLATRGVTAFILSFSGGMLSAFMTVILLKIPKKYISLIGVSIMGAFSHNLGQLFAASVIMKTPSLWYYLPMLAVFSLIFGSITGLILIGIDPHRINRLFQEREEGNGK